MHEQAHISMQGIAGGGAGCGYNLTRQRDWDNYGALQQTVSVIIPV